MTIRTERHGTTARVVIDRGPRANVLDRGEAEALVAALRKASVDPDVRVVLLRGAGERAFCGGYDLGSVEQSIGSTGLEELMGALEAIPLPTIAVLNGHAVGAGLELACRCDLRVVRQGARVGLPAVRLGVAYRPEGLSKVLAVVPAARRLLLTGEQWPADELPGFADAVAAPAEIDEVAQRLADLLASASPAAAGYTARALRLLAGPAPTSAEVLRQLHEERERVLNGPDLAEAVAARKQGRAPRFAPRSERDVP